MSLAKRLTQLRKAAHLTPAELARRSGLPLQRVLKIEQGETGDPRWQTVVKLARGLGVSVAVFADETPRKARTRRRRIPLAELLEGITEENRHGEVDWGPPVGKEVW